MGFSVTITSSIILIVMFVLSTSMLITVFQSLREISCIAEDYINRGRERLDVTLQLGVDLINATSCAVTVKNTGSKVIFLEDQAGRKWNDIIISYGNETFWTSYIIDDYIVLEIKVSGTNRTFRLENHPYIEAGEEAYITFNLPNGAPEIPVNGVISVVFVTHYGVAAKGEGAAQ